jgi:hypothetical protein
MENVRNDLVEQVDWLVNYVENKSYRVLHLGHTDEWSPKEEIPLFVKEITGIRDKIRALGDVS